MRARLGALAVLLVVAVVGCDGGKNAAADAGQDGGGLCQVVSATDAETYWCGDWAWVEGESWTGERVAPLSDTNPCNRGCDLAPANLCQRGWLSCKCAGGSWKCVRLYCGTPLDGSVPPADAAPADGPADAAAD